MKTLPKTAQELDRRFDAGENLESLGFDLSKATQPGLEGKRINIDLPADFLEALDKEAARRGITRQSLIKVWLYERLHSDSIAKATSRLRESIISMLKSKDQPLSNLDIARELVARELVENFKETRTQSTKNVRSAKGAAKRLIREGK